ncbi:Guanylate cyclase 2G [Trichinella pseudospiralis]|uniref:Guanylate cyclase n=1 Tax=Trichinella pseudospiralis TaxID=6337 RepID=A0A0V1IYC7_TRIPS|nr:Guanylate cyclase 2G [Trichinella pseudospiralis]KRZ27754.1 Guanylate cyclase 2G [Trichinella pseudospiralis]
MVLLHADGSFALAGCLLRKMSIWLYQLTVALVFKLGFAKVPKCDLNEPSQIFYQLHDLTSEIGHVKFYDRARYCADVPDRSSYLLPLAWCPPLLWRSLMSILSTVGDALLVIFSLPDTDTLVLSGEVLAKIYSGDIVLWNDTSIRQLNPDIILPGKVIRPYAYTGISRATYVFTHFLAEYDEHWRETRGVFDYADLINNGTFSATWNRTSSQIGFIDEQDVASDLYDQQYIIAYMTMFNDLWSGVNVASILNKAGTVITYSDLKTAVKRSMSELFTNSNLSKPLYLDPVTVSNAYPLVYFSFVTMNGNSEPSESCYDLVEFFAFFLNSIDEELSERFAGYFNLFPLTVPVKFLVEQSVLKNIYCNNESLHSLVNLVIQQENKQSDLLLSLIAVSVCVAAVALAVISLLSYKRYRVIKAYRSKNWILSEYDIKFWDYMVEGNKYSSMSSSSASRQSKGDEFNPDEYWKFYLAASGRFRYNEVLMFGSECLNNPLNFQFDTCKRLFTILRLNSCNIAPLIGLVIKNLTVYHVYESPGRGSLHQTLESAPYELNDEIKFILSMDVANGIQFLHKHGIVHGLLDTWNIFLDKNWTAKISNWSHIFICEKEGEFHHLKDCSELIEKVNDEYHLKRLIFRHRALLLGQVTAFGFEHDLYSFAMILTEIFTREVPFADRSAVIGWKGMLEEVVKDPNLSPICPDIPGPVKDLIVKLTKPNPEITAEGVTITLQLNQPTSKGIVDILLKTMENYMTHLEEKVEERTTELKAVTARMEMLLNSMLPRDVAIRLQNGQKVEPEYYQSVTIYFSDIVSFTTLCSESTALEVVNLLNALYTMFDNNIERFDVYKVETIGDAYMCVSGLPKRNGIKHVEQISRLAIALVEGVDTFIIPHRPDRKLQVRVGVHSGPVMTGVVGIKMPRFCLFGDTVNTASRMESTSLPNKIQASEDTANLLRQFPEFIVEERGEFDVKFQRAQNSAYRVVMKIFCKNSELSCKSINDCPEQYLCSDGLCSLAVPTLKSCQSHSMCDSSEHCMYGFCWRLLKNVCPSNTVAYNPRLPLQCSTSASLNICPIGYDCNADTGYCCSQFPVAKGGQNCKNKTCQDINSYCTNEVCTCLPGYSLKLGVCTRDGYALNSPCALNADCLTPYSECNDGSCQCRSGFSPRDARCVPNPYRCTFGEPMTVDNQIIECSMTKLTVASLRDVFPFSLDNFETARSVELLLVRANADTCPEDGYCASYEYPESQFFGTGGISSRGFCCPRPKAKCPAGVPYEIQKGKTCQQLCPSDSHFCYYDYFLLEPVCCPRPCKINELAMNGRCVLQKSIGEECSSDEECFSHNAFCLRTQTESFCGCSNGEIEFEGNCIVPTCFYGEPLKTGKGELIRCTEKCPLHEYVCFTPFQVCCLIPVVTTPDSEEFVAIGENLTDSSEVIVPTTVVDVITTTDLFPTTDDLFTTTETYTTTSDDDEAFTKDGCGGEGSTTVEEAATADDAESEQISTSTLPETEQQTSVSVLDDNFPEGNNSESSTGVTQSNGVTEVSDGIAEESAATAAAATTTTSSTVQTSSSQIVVMVIYPQKELTDAPKVVEEETKKEEEEEVTMEDNNTGGASTIGDATASVWYRKKPIIST